MLNIKGVLKLPHYSLFMSILATHNENSAAIFNLKSNKVFYTCVGFQGYGSVGTSVHFLHRYYMVWEFTHVEVGPQKFHS